MGLFLYTSVFQHYLRPKISGYFKKTITKRRWEVSMDVEWSTVVELEQPWYQGVKLYTISRGAEHNSESYQRYHNCRDLENFI